MASAADGRRWERDRALTAELDAVVLATLQPLTGGLSIIFAGFAVFNFFGLVLPGEVTLPVLTLDVTLCVFCGLSWSHLRAGKLLLGLANPLAVTLAVMILGDALLLMWLLLDPRYSVYIPLLLIGTGCVLLSTRWLWASQILILGPWAVSLLHLATPREFVFYGLAGAAATVLSVIVHAARLRSYRRLAELRVADVQRRLQLTSELRDSEGRFRQIVETAFEGIGMIDADNRIEYANPRLVEMLGYTAGELVGRDLIHLVHPEDREQARRRAEARDRRGTEQYEVRYLRKDGTTLWALVSSSPMTDSRGVEGGRLGLITDITERKRSEEARERYARRLETLHEIEKAILALESPRAIAQTALTRLLSMVPCEGGAVLLGDPDGGVQLLLAVENGRRSAAAPNGLLDACLECWERVGPRCESVTSGSVGCAVATRLAHREVRSLGCVPMALDSRRLGVLLVYSGDPDAFGSQHHEVVTEVADTLAVALHQARLRKAAEAEQERLVGVVEDLPEGVVVLDRARRVLLVNGAAEAHLQVLAGVSVGGILHRLGDVPIEDLIGPRKGGGWHGLTVESHGRLHHFDVVAKRLQGSADPFTTIIVSRDVTEERGFQERVQAQQRLTAVGHLAAGIAHDFNNILQSILITSQLARTGTSLPDEIDHALETVIDQAGRAALLVRQILDFSRRSVRTREPVDLAVLLSDMMRLLGRTISEQVRLELEIESTAEDHMILADATQVQQAVTNLVLNAQDAMPRGGDLGISLSVREIEDGEPPPFPGMASGSWVELRVADSGVGIPEEHRSKVFEPFFTTKEKGRGTGLGLAQVYGIVKHNEGFIDFVSSEGEGTTFSLYFPRISDTSTASVIEDEFPFRQGQGELIMIVEDEAPLLRVLSRTLSTLGYKVVATDDTAEAVALGQRFGEEVRLVLSDVVMPGMSGPELLARLSGPCPAARFVLMSGYQVEENPVELPSGLSVTWIEKPFPFRRLASLLSDILQS